MENCWAVVRVFSQINLSSAFLVSYYRIRRARCMMAVREYRWSTANDSRLCEQAEGYARDRSTREPRGTSLCPLHGRRRHRRDSGLGASRARNRSSKRIGGGGGGTRGRYGG